MKSRPDSGITTICDGMNRPLSLLFYVTLLWALVPSTGWANHVLEAELKRVRAGRRITAVRISEPVEVDGILNEPVWQNASPAVDFYQKTPQSGHLSEHRTEVRFLYDETTLYIGAILFDDEPQRAVTNELKRDFSGFQNDTLAIVLDTFHDRKNAYGFLTNQGGAMRDTLAFDEGRRNDANWNGVWWVRTAVQEDSWTVEYAIPFKTLRFPDHGEQQWGLNILRIVRRLNEFATWSPVPRQFSHYNVAYAGLLTGIEGVQPGGSLQVKPFATFQANHDSSTGWETDADGGVDLKYALTSDLLLDATYRTDFSQVEADAQQINLTRFSLFFPEKREFFLENPASFQVGLTDLERTNNDLVPFFSRRIGLSDEGDPIPVVGGVRLTGRSGGFGVGFLNMQTESEEGRPGDNFIAARVSRGVGGGFTLGGSYFGREAGADPTSTLAEYNRVGGLDLRFSPSRTFDVEALAFGSATDGTGSDFAGRAGMRLQTDAHRAKAIFLHVGEDFRHDLGFVRRKGIGKFYGEYTRTFRPTATYRWVQGYSIVPTLNLTGNSQYDEWLTRVGGLKYRMEFPDSGSLEIEVNRIFERLRAPFEIRSGVEIPVGDYTTTETRFSYNSDSSSRLSGSVELSKGDFWTGTRTTPRGSLRFRLNAHLAVTLPPKTSPS